MSLLKHSLFIWFQQPFINRLCGLDGCLIDATLQLLSLDVDANVFKSVWAFAFRQQVTGRDSLKDRPPRPVKIAESDIDVSSVLCLLKPTFWALSPLLISLFALHRKLLVRPEFVQVNTGIGVRRWYTLWGEASSLSVSRRNWNYWRGLFIFNTQFKEKNTCNGSFILWACTFFSLIFVFQCSDCFSFDWR